VSGAYVSSDIKELEGLAAILNHSALSSTDRMKLMKGLGTGIVEQSRSRILETQEDPEGNKWQDYAASTLKGLKAKGLEKVVSLLNRKGYLQSSIKVRQGGEWSVLVGSDREYAGVHQWGYKPKNIPARPYLGLSSDDISDLTELAEIFLKRRMQ
jgi:phage virion morphogenesis protein